MSANASVRSGIFDPYLPTGLLRHLAAGSGLDPGGWSAVEGSMLFCDLSGFTALSERLQRRGPEGAELLTEAINGCFTGLLALAYANGASMIKFGGDALLLFYEGDDHARRACRSGVLMRRALRVVGKIRTGGARVDLRMTVGIHSGTFHFFCVGGSHLEYVVAGPAATAVVRTEEAANSGQIVVSEATASFLPARCLGAAAGGGFLLAASPLERDVAPRLVVARPPDERAALALSTAVRAHVQAGRQPAEHRRVTVAFLHFDGTDSLVAGEGPEVAAGALTELVADASAAADEFEVCFLGSDVDADGGKIILCAGAPRATGDEEERMLLALRRIADGRRRLPVRIGVHRGPAFCGEIGPFYRSAYTLMGDTVNLAARLMARAGPGDIYATHDVLARSVTAFRTAPMAPFMVKGKTRPVEAVAVGPVRQRVVLAGDDALTVTGAAGEPLPLIGRRIEMAAVEAAWRDAGRGRGRCVEITGDAGIGKSRLLEAARALAPGAVGRRVICDGYSASTPYAAWRSLLLAELGLNGEETGDVVLARLRSQVRAHNGDLDAWVPLLADTLGVEAPTTPEVEALAPDFRRIRTHEVAARLLAPFLARPTLVEIDHAHAMDEASSALLASLVPTLRASHWLVVIARRPGPGGLTVADDGGPDGDGSDGDVSLCLRLGPLPEADSRRLAELATDDEPLSAHVLDLAVRRAGGNPAFLLDTLAAAAGGQAGALPDNARAAAMARIDLLAAEDRAVVRMASVLGLEFHERHLAALMDGIPEGTTTLPFDGPAPAVSASAWARLGAVFERRPGIGAHPAAAVGRARFRSAALREAAYASLPFRERRALHGCLAARLDAEAADGADVDPASLSLHHLLAGEHARAHALALVAAEAALTRAAPADAARLYRRALEAGRHLGGHPRTPGHLGGHPRTPGHLGGHPRTPGHLGSGATAMVPEDQVWEALGGALRRAGERGTAAVAFGQARRLAAPDPLRQAGLLFLLTELEEGAGRVSATVRWAQKGLRALEGVDGDEAAGWRARLRTSVASVRLRQGRLEEAIRLCRTALDEADRAGADSSRAKACYILDWALVNAGRADEAVHSAAAVEIYLRLGDFEELASVSNNLGMFAYWEGRWDDAVRLYREGAEYAERAGKTGGAAYADTNVGEVLADQGRYDEAGVHLERALRHWRVAGNAEGMAFTRMLLGRLAARTGRGEEGSALLTGARQAFLDLRLDAEAAQAGAFLAEAALFAGDALEARRLVAELDLRSLEGFADKLAPLLGRVEALALAASDEPDPTVERALIAALAAARRCGSDYDAAVILHILCRRSDAPEPDREAERATLVARLGIERFPEPLAAVGSGPTV